MSKTNITIEAKEVLMQLVDSLHQLSFDDYTKALPVLSNSSIGGHTRHIIELFQQLILGYESGEINYDNRERNIQIQENVDFAIECIALVICDLDRPNKVLQLETVYNNNQMHIETNYHRELMYNIEHCIHHQAIIKIGCSELDVKTLHENFGVAKSTILYRQAVAQ